MIESPQRASYSTMHIPGSSLSVQASSKAAATGNPESAAESAIVGLWHATLEPHFFTLHINCNILSLSLDRVKGPCRWQHALYSSRTQQVRKSRYHAWVCISCAHSQSAFSVQSQRHTTPYHLVASYPTMTGHPVLALPTVVYTQERTKISHPVVVRLTNRTFSY